MEHASQCARQGRNQRSSITFLPSAGQRAENSWSSIKSKLKAKRNSIVSGSGFRRTPTCALCKTADAGLLRLQQTTMLVMSSEVETSLDGCTPKTARDSSTSLRMTELLAEV